MSLYNSKIYLDDLIAIYKHAVGITELFNRKVLVTGATGTIGSCVVDTLLRLNQQKDAGIQVYAAGRSVKRLQQRFGGVPSDSLLEFVEYDAMKDISFDLSVDYVIHAAGNAFPGAFHSDPVGTIIGNVMGTERLLQYTAAHGGKRFLYVSSGEVYGQGDLSLDSFLESYSGYVDPTSTRSCYPNSKRATETLCVSFTDQYGLDTVIVRPCHTYGPGITRKDNRANAQFLRSALHHEDIVMKSAGTQMRSYNYVADCVSGLLTVLMKGASKQAYNLANPEVKVTIAQFAQMVAESTGVQVLFEKPSDSEMKDQTPIVKQVLSTDKLESLGWRPAFSLKQGVEHTLDAMRAC